MKNKFVLDVNTIVFAQGHCNAKGDCDFAPATLIYLIAQNCHKLVYTKALKDKYLERLNDDRFTRLFKHLLFNSEKAEFRDYLPDYPFEKNLPPDDVEIVKLAVFAKAIFVTSDDRLKTKIKKLEIPQSYNLEVKDPSSAQSLAQVNARV